jgi:hypothetical protein
MSDEINRLWIIADVFEFGHWVTEHKIKARFLAFDEHNQHTLVEFDSPKDLAFAKLSFEIYTPPPPMPLPGDYKPFAYLERTWFDKLWNFLLSVWATLFVIFICAAVCVGVYYCLTWFFELAAHFYIIL